MLKTTPWADAAPERRTTRLLAAAALRTAGRALDRLARQLAAPARRVSEPPTLEFHAEAGAPEGALYANGELVAKLPVSRL